MLIWLCLFCSWNAISCPTLAELLKICHQVASQQIKGLKKKKPEHRTVLKAWSEVVLPNVYPQSQILQVVDVLSFFSKIISRAAFFQKERVKDFLGNLALMVSDPHSSGTVSWSLPATSARGHGHPLYLLVPIVPASPRKDFRKQQHHLGFLCGKWGSCINYTFPSLFPLTTACARSSGYLGPRGDAGLRLLQPEKESLWWQSRDDCFSGE